MTKHRWIRGIFCAASLAIATAVPTLAEARYTGNVPAGIADMPATSLEVKVGKHRSHQAAQKAQVHTSQKLRHAATAAKVSKKLKSTRKSKPGKVARKLKSHKKHKKS
jgi:hypothetical protein